MRKSAEIVSLILIFSTSLLLRLASLDVFISGDETKWTCRSINFHAALVRGDLAETCQVEHPGVITMWLGTMAIPLDVAGDWVRLCQETGGSRLSRAGGPEVLAKLPPLLFRARRLVALLTWLSIIAIYLLIRKLFGGDVALLSAVLVALDPFYLAHSRLLHLDAILTGFMTISVLSMLIYLMHRVRWALILSGVAAGLAILNKSPALFLGPSAILLVAVWNRVRGEQPLRSIKELLIWGVTAGLVVFTLWPALWVNPVGALQKVLEEAIHYAEKPHLNFNFFLGEPRADPGPWFYPVAWLFRTTPLVILGLLLSLVGSVRPLAAHREDERWGLGALGGYALLFSLFMTMGAKKFDRYLLPIFPSLDIIAAAGLSWGFKLAVRERKSLFAIAVAMVLLAQFGLLWPYRPYYLTYYNPLLGGPRQAVKVLLVGWGEGMEKAAQYLNSREDAEGLHVNTDHISQFAPFFVGHTSGLKDPDPEISDYYIFYVNSVQRQRDPEILNRYYGREEPEYVVTLNGVDYVWIYPNTSYVEPLSYVESRAHPGEDLILLDIRSVIAKYYKGSLPLYILNGDQDEAQIVRRLQEITKGRKRIWYITYPQVSGDLRGLIHYQLGAHAYRLEERSFPDIHITLYRLTDPHSFRVASAGVPTRVNFEGRILLEGYGFDEDKAQWGRDFGVALRWRSLRKPERNYAAFLHLIDDQGHIWGQGDKWLMKGLAPTIGWKAGEAVLDRYNLTLLKGTPPGRYRLKIGVYEVESGRRLRIMDEEGNPLGTEYDLEEVEVVRSPLELSPSDLYIQHPLEREIAGRVKLLGYGLNKDVVAFGEDFTLGFYWQALREMDEDYTLLIRLRGEDGRVWAEGKFPLINRFYTTSKWSVGEVVWGQYDLTVDREAPLTEGSLAINLLDPQGRPLLEEDLVLAKLAIEGRRFEAPEIGHPMWFNLGDKVTFLGYDLGETEVKPGGKVRLTLYWRARGEMDTSYTVFTHLLDENSELWGQKDSLPCEGRHPTTEWLEGEVVVDRYELPVEANAPLGKYVIEIGMYDGQTGERLPVFDRSGGRIPDDRILLGRIEVK